MRRSDPRGGRWTLPRPRPKYPRAGPAPREAEEAGAARRVDPGAQGFRAQHCTTGVRDRCVSPPPPADEPTPPGLRHAIYHDLAPSAWPAAFAHCAAQRRSCGIRTLTDTAPGTEARDPAHLGAAQNGSGLAPTALRDGASQATPCVIARLVAS